MAKQSGLIKLEGTIGDVTFYKSRNGYVARTKGGISKERMKNDPAFQRTRENWAEFGRAGAAGRLLRTAFRPLFLQTADGRMSSRLSQELVRIVKADSINSRGERRLLDANLSTLTGFDFNERAPLNSTFYASYEVEVDRAGGAVRVEVPEFSKSESVAMPQGGTHSLYYRRCLP